MAEVRTIPLSDRQRLEALLDRRSAADALASYYALEHPQDRVKLFGYAAPDGEAIGFLAVAQTGLDLFRPLLVPFIAKREFLRRLLRDALRPGQEFLLHLPADQLSWLEGEVEVHLQRVTELLRLERSAYEPVLNVLVVEADGPSHTPRYEIRTAEGIQAAAGVNWQGERFAEVYLEADEAARGRSLTKSVLSALVGRLLGERRTALYRVETRRVSVKTEAFHLGFRPTGVSSALVEGVLLPGEEEGEA